MSTNGLRFFVSAYLFVIFVLTVRYGLWQYHALGEWGIEDWLINYGGGFIRRGLSGQIIL